MSPKGRSNSVWSSHIRLFLISCCWMFAFWLLSQRRTGRWTVPLCYWPTVAPCGGTCCPTIGCVGRSGGQRRRVAGVRLFLLAGSRTVCTLRVSAPPPPRPTNPLAALPTQHWSMCKSFHNRRHKGSYEQGFVLVLCQDLVIGFETVPAEKNRKRKKKSKRT